MDLTPRTPAAELPRERRTAARDPAAPAVPHTLEQTGLSRAFVSDLLLRTLYVQGARSGDQLADSIRLPFAILDDQLLVLQQRRLVEVRGTQGVGRRGYTFDLTREGRSRSQEIMSTNRYVGPAPVPLNKYWNWVDRQSMESAGITRESIFAGFGGLVLDGDFIDRLGPAINSGRSLFLHGPAGNGKTSIAEAIAEMLGDSIYMPHAIEAEGQIIQLYDPVSHRIAPTEEPSEENGEGWLRAAPPHDQRFVRIERPAVMVGGELTLDQLELQRDPQADLFRAPPQLKANGGVFILDDFGRQRVRARDLLNRWMIPLDRRVDFLSLPTGHKLPVPFECLLIFATNLSPTQLVEEAFLRRIRYKFRVGDPTRDQYAEIFRRCCDARGIPYDETAVDYIWRECYGRMGLSPRSCHPRDLTNQLCDAAGYTGVEPSLDEDLLQRACRTYFLDSSGEESAGDGTGEAGGRGNGDGG